MIALYQWLLLACVLGFLTSAPVVLSLHVRHPLRMPWGLVVVLTVAAGWIFTILFAWVEDKLFAPFRDTIPDFHTFAPFSFMVSRGWTYGLAYLAACLPLYRVFQENGKRRPLRPLAAVLTTLFALTISRAIPPWSESSLGGSNLFLCLYACFLLCAGLSHLILRRLRLEAACYPFVVAFLVALLLRQVLRVASWIAIPGLRLEISRDVEWSALFAILFTLFWWIAIRKANTVVAAAPVRRLQGWLSGLVVLAVMLVGLAIRFIFVPAATPAVATIGTLYFGDNLVAFVDGYEQRPEAGAERLRGRIKLNGVGIRGPELSVTLNKQYLVTHLHPDANGIFEIPLAAGKWAINEIEVGDWDERPKDRQLILFSNREPRKNAERYSQLYYIEPDAVEVALPAMSQTLAIDLDLRDALVLTWPPSTTPGGAFEGQLSTTAIAWQPVKGASEYEVQIRHIRMEHNTRSPSHILTRRVTELSLPLASLPQRAATTAADEYSVHVFAFDVQGRLITESNRGLDDRTFKLVGATRLGREEQDGAIGPAKVISAEFETNEERLESVTSLLYQNKLGEARRLLDQVTGDAPPGLALVARGRLAALAGDCGAAIKLFDQADREGGCTSDARKLCPVK